MRVLVTGAGGFVGRHVAHLLVAEGDTVTATVWDGEAGPVPEGEVPGAVVRELDVRDREAVERVVEEARPEVVIHLAALSHVGASWSRPAEYFRVNVLGTEHVVRAAARSGGARVLLASSGEVYGRVRREDQPIAEDHPVAPGSPYALSKAAAERIALALPGARVVLVRSFNLVGPGQAPTFALPSFARQLAEIHRGRQEPVLRVGNLAARRDFVHVEAAARGYLLLARSGEAGTAYHVASGHPRSIAEALDALVRISGVDAEIEPDPERMRPVDQPLLCGAPDRLRALGWSPEPGFETAVEELWREALEATAAG